uniref:Uncharacterized protein n=1 Tax=Oryza punctata TaxID=4537 RepID=A0A0E0M7Z9_ORYPU
MADVHHLSSVPREVADDVTHLTLANAMRLRREKTCVAMTPRSIFQHWLELGTHIMDRLANLCAWLASRTARHQSCLVNAYLAASADDTTTAVTRPSLSAIIGPCTTLSINTARLSASSCRPSQASSMEAAVEAVCRWYDVFCAASESFHNTCTALVRTIPMVVAFID